MKLFVFTWYDNFSLHVCKDRETAEKLFPEITWGQKIDNRFKYVEEVTEVDGYEILVGKKLNR